VTGQSPSSGRDARRAPEPASPLGRQARAVSWRSGARCSRVPRRFWRSNLLDRRPAARAGVGSQAESETSLTMRALLVVVVVFAVPDRRNDSGRHVAQQHLRRAHRGARKMNVGAPWLRSMRAEAEIEISARVGITALERIVDDQRVRRSHRAAGLARLLRRIIRPRPAERLRRRESGAGATIGPVKKRLSPTSEGVPRAPRWVCRCVRRVSVHRPETPAGARRRPQARGRALPTLPAAARAARERAGAQFRNAQRQHTVSSVDTENRTTLPASAWPFRAQLSALTRRGHRRQPKSNSYLKIRGETLPDEPAGRVPSNRPLLPGTRRRR